MLSKRHFSFYLPPGLPAGNYNLHHVCVYLCACVGHAVFSETTTVTHFYPTALKGCRGVVFTHGGWAGRRREEVCPGCISETVRSRKLILGRDIG